MDRILGILLMRVLVCGGRNYTDINRVYEVLDALSKETEITAIIHGAARGVDSIAGAWARQKWSNSDLHNNISEIRYPAEWALYGPQAGVIRNKQMLIEGMPDLVVAFPGGPGTANMVHQARRNNVEVRVIT
jgi:hypothetical protein